MKTSKKIIWLTIFSIAMGYLETSVVIYLRLLYYPEGFDFPIKPLASNVAMFEIWREVATIVMLLSVGVFLGKNRVEQFAYFIFSFAIWDIFYYVFLYITLGWPSSLLTWDLLFLIPTPWVGPVICPIMISCLMIVLCLIIVRNSKEVTILISEWALLIGGSFIVILSWTIDYVTFMLDNNKDVSIWSISKSELMDLTQQYIPHEFYWGTFTVGTVIIMTGMFKIYQRLHKNQLL